jgi:peptidyl-prolyl cis-trans isomerase C
MKLYVAALLFSAFLFAQAPSPVHVTPGPPTLGAPAATPGSTVPPDTVVLEVNGKKYTKEEVDQLIASLPPQFQKAAHSQPQMLNQVFLMKRLAEDAEKAGLDKQSPYKDALEFNRLQVLSQAELVTIQATAVISRLDQEKYYKDHPEKFRQAKVRVIYVAFNPTPGKAAAEGKKLPTEEEARVKIEDLRKQILGGADFGKLARENSDDKASAAKDGDFGMITPKSAYPAAIKAAVFALKPGEVSEPVKEPNGYYLIRAEDVSVPPFEQVGTEVLQDMRQDHFTQVMKGLQAQYTVKVENPSYFTPSQPPQLQQVR